MPIRKNFPFYSGRVYTPELASPEEMAELHKALHIKRVVIVPPSVYGPDNSATLFGMKARGADARGVAVIDDKTTDAQLDAMHAAGVRGIRLNLATGGTNDPNVARQRFEAAVNRMKTRGWHVQMYTNLAVISGIKDLIPGIAGSGRHRSFRRRAGCARRRAAGICAICRACEVGQGLRQDFRRLSGVQATRPTIPMRRRSPKP